MVLLLSSLLLLLEMKDQPSSISELEVSMGSHPHATTHEKGAGDSPEYAYSSSSRAAESSARSIRLSSFVSNTLMIIET